MTFCVGMIHGRSVYLTGDSAITYEGFGIASSLPTRTSNFSEAPVDEPGRSVREAGLKLVPIAGNVAIAYAGDVSRALEALRLLRAGYHDGVPVEEWLRVLANSMELARGRPFAFLIARATPDGPELWRWQSEPAVLERLDSYAAIGKLDTWHPQFVETFARYVSQSNVAEEHMLPVLLASQQALVLTDLLLERGVGGVFAGLRVHAGGVQWMEDTNYVILPPGREAGSIVTVLARGGAIVTSSTFTDGYTFFLNGSEEDPTGERWMEAFTQAAVDDLQRAAARFWIAINPANRSIAVVKAGAPTTETSCVSIQRLDGDQYRLSINNVLRAYLDLPPTNAPDDAAMFFRFQFANEPTAVQALAHTITRVQASQPTQR